MIFLFESSATEFNNGGLGSLSDIASGFVEEERNGMFELTMQYPVDGRHYKDLRRRRLISAKPNPFDDPEPFRIYAMSKPLNGIVTVNARHISYDMTGLTVKPFEASDVQTAFYQLKNNSVVNCPFTFDTDKETQANFVVTKPTSMRSLLGGTEGSILDVYGKGEYQFMKFRVSFLLNRGSNKGVTIRYGKNLTDINQEENCSNVWTAVFPYWYSEEDGLVTLDDFIVSVPGTFDYNKIMPLDLSDKFQDKPTKPQLREATDEYLANNELGVPKVNLKVSFVQLAQSEEYKQYKLLEEVRLCDTVNVEFPKLGVSATSKCVKTTYNIITDKYESIELGETSTNLADTISEQAAAISKSPTETNVFKTAVTNATKLITGGLGGYVMLHSSSNSSGNIPDEILILSNSPDYLQPQPIWRWNKDGLGFSSQGYNGEFATAITSDGHIVANFITAGTMEAQHIKGGLLSDDAGFNFWNLSTGEFKLSWNTKIGSESNYVELENLGSFRLETPFEWSQDNTTAYYEAALYHMEEYVTDDYPTQWFSWYLRNEKQDRSIARGKYMNLTMDDVGYIGTITCLFRTFDTKNLLTRSGKQFTTRSGKIMTIWVEKEE